MNLDRIVVVTRKTRLEEAVRRFNTARQARFYVESRGQSFDDYELEYDNYSRARDALMRALPRESRIQTVDREFLPNVLVPPDALVVTLGQDGIVVNTAKYLSGQPVLAVNPDPDRFDGVLLPFLPEDVPLALRELREDRHGTREITMARVRLNDGQELMAFNDFFMGTGTHASARYTLSFNGESERHSSSGIVVSTPAGSTGWLSSFLNMACGISAFAGQPVELRSLRMNWEERRLIFMVREPFRSNWSGANLVAGEITGQRELVLESHMAENGIIFSDGMQQDALEFNAGTTATMGLAERTTRLVVPRGRES